MGDVYFYHLTRQPLEAALALLLEKALAAGWHVVVRGRDAKRLDWLDEKLWLGPEEGFLPHGRAGGPHDALQPVLLSEKHEAGRPNGAQCVISIDGAEIDMDEVAALTRACVLFDGAEPAAVETARTQWRQVTEAGTAAQYWSEDSGRWQKKAESGGKQ